MTDSEYRDGASRPDHNVSGRSTLEKALRINLDDRKYGTIAEIGAGQEVARQFFKTGAAAGTIAKTMSAYDMKFSDAIYGVQEDRRYVSRARVKAMLDKEFGLVIERVGKSRAKSSRYFCYAATATTRAWQRDNECHAWCGVKIQMYPKAEPSEIIVHVRMLDSDASGQQDALGAFGVNLIYAAFYYFEDPQRIIDSLSDNLGQDRIEVDSIEFRGPYFEDVDNCRINLHLIRSWKTRAIMFYPDGSVAVPAEMLYKKNVLTIRGSFRPVTNLNVDMIERSLEAFCATDGVSRDNTLVLAEISLNDDRGNDRRVPEEEIITSVGLLNSLGYSVMISDYTRYFTLRAYFRQFTQLHKGIVLGMVNLRQIFDEDSYRGVEGGILEAFGKLFPGKTRLFVYPEIDPNGALVDHTHLELPETQRHLYRHLLANRFICGIEPGDPGLLAIQSREILMQIPLGPGEWQTLVPEPVAAAIVEQRLFGYRG